MLQLSHRFQSDGGSSRKIQEFTSGLSRRRHLGTVGWLLYVAVTRPRAKSPRHIDLEHMDNDYLTRFKLEARAGLMLNQPNLFAR